MESNPPSSSDLERSLRGLSQREVDTHTARAELATSVGYALWGPLAHLSSASARLLSVELEDGARREVELIAAASEMIHELLAKRLTLEPRPETSGLQRAVFDLQEALAPVLKAFAPRARSHSVEFACSIASDVPPVLIGEPATLRAIVRLLLDEALRAAGPEPIQLELGVIQREGGDSALELVLSGLGDDPACAAGLAACARLARQLDGRLWLELPQGGFGRAVLQVRCERVPERRRRPRTEGGCERVTVVAARGVAREALVADLGALGIEVELADSIEALSVPEAGATPRTALIHDEAWLARGDDQVIETRLFGPIFLIASQPGRAADARESALGVRGVLREPVLPREWSDVLGRAMLGPRRMDSAGEGPAPAEFLTVLLAEGDSAQRAVARGVLERLGHEVVSAEDGLSLIGLLDERPFDLLLVDIDLPVLDGVSVAQLVRAREMRNGGRTPIVVMAASAERAGRVDLTEAGIDGCLQVPLDTDSLSWTLARLCGTRGYESGAA